MSEFGSITHINETGISIGSVSYWINGQDLTGFKEGDIVEFTVGEKKGNSFLLTSIKKREKSTAVATQKPSELGTQKDKPPKKISAVTTGDDPHVVLEGSRGQFTKKLKGDALTQVSSVPDGAYCMYKAEGQYAIRIWEVDENGKGKGSGGKGGFGGSRYDPAVEREKNTSIVAENATTEYRELFCQIHEDHVKIYLQAHPTIAPAQVVSAYTAVMKDTLIEFEKAAEAILTQVEKHTRKVKEFAGGQS